MLTPQKLPFAQLPSAFEGFGIHTSLPPLLWSCADPNYHQLPGGLVGGPDDFDQWVDDRDQFNPAVTVSIANNAGFSAALAGLVRYDINMAKCQQGNGFIQVRRHTGSVQGLWGPG